MREGTFFLGFSGLFVWMFFLFVFFYFFGWFWEMVFLVICLCFGGLHRAFLYFVWFARFVADFLGGFGTQTIGYWITFAVF